MNALVPAQYDLNTPAQVKENYFTPLDDTCTSLRSAALNAQMVAEGVRSLKNVTCRSPSGIHKLPEV